MNLERFGSEKSTLGKSNVFKGFCDETASKNEFGAFWKIIFGEFSKIGFGAFSKNEFGAFWKRTANKR